MSILKRVGCCLSAIAVLGISENAIAQELVDLGLSSKGVPAFLQQESPRSTNFKIVQQYGDGILQYSFSAGCKNRSVFLKGADIYNAAGSRVEHFVYNEASVPPRKSLAEKALTKVCRNLGAAGW